MKIALQSEYEFSRFIELMRRENARSYLEIGSAYGGSLWVVAAYGLPKGSRIVSVDHMGRQELLDSCIELRDLGYDVHPVFGSSQDQRTIATVRAMGPFDVCLIDADHTYESVASDWKNYGPMSRLVAFHDITHIPDIRRLWDEIKVDYRHEEVIEAGLGHMGIGILYRDGLV